MQMTPDLLMFCISIHLLAFVIFPIFTFGLALAATQSASCYMGNGRLHARPHGLRHLAATWLQVFVSSMAMANLIQKNWCHKCWVSCSKWPNMAQYGPIQRDVSRFWCFLIPLSISSASCQSCRNPAFSGISCVSWDPLSAPTWRLKLWAIGLMKSKLY